MQDFDSLKSELNGRSELIIGDIRRKIKNLNHILASSIPLGFVSIDVDVYTSSKSALKLIAYSSPESLLPTVGLHFDDVWSEWGYNRFAGELLSMTIGMADSRPSTTQCTCSTRSIIRIALSHYVQEHKL
jgi:hypothetical protein